MKYFKFLPFYILSLIPLPLLYLVSDFMFVIVYHLIQYRRKVVRTNLKNSFPDKAMDGIIHIEKKFYKQLCDIAVESIKALTISKNSIAKRFQIKNKNFIDELFVQKRNIVMYTAHYGNWEWLSFLPLFLPYQIQTFYQKLSNSYFNDFMLVLRSRFDSKCIESNQGYKAMLKSQQEDILTLTCIIGDQSPQKHSSKHWGHFLNQETAFLIGADRIAKKLNQAVIYVSFIKPKRGKYEVEFKLIEDKPKESSGEGIIDKYVKVLENSIINSPELWLWSHRRWKLTKPDFRILPANDYR